MKHAKKWRSVLSILLALLMVAGQFGGVFAIEKEDGPIKYVSLGESMTNGYGTVGYYPVYDPDVHGFIDPESMDRMDRNGDGKTNTFGLNRTEVTTYASLFADYLAETYDAEVDWQPWAISGQRPEDFYWLMQENWNMELDAGHDKDHLLFSEDGTIYNGDMYTTEIWKNGNGNEHGVSRFLSGKYGRFGSTVGRLGDDINRGEVVWTYAGTNGTDQRWDRKYRYSTVEAQE